MTSQPTIGAEREDLYDLILYYIIDDLFILLCATCLVVMSASTDTFNASHT